MYFALLKTEKFMNFFRRFLTKTQRAQRSQREEEKNAKDLTQRRGGVEPLVREFLSEKFSFYYDILSFNEEHDINNIIFHTTTLRPLRLCASA